MALAGNDIKQKQTQNKVQLILTDITLYSIR
jgi:hypothetical protein